MMINVPAFLKIKPLDWKQLYPEQEAYPMDWHGRGILGSLYVVRRYRPSECFYSHGQPCETLTDAFEHCQKIYENEIKTSIEV